MANEQRVVELVIDASGVEAGSRRAEAAYEHLGDRAAAAAERAKAAFQTQTQVLSANLPTAIDRAGAAYDRLRAKTDPVLAAQLKLESDMTRSLSVINRAILLGVTTEERAGAEIAKLRQQQIAQLDAVRQAYERTSDVQVKAANQNSRGLSEGNRAFIGRDIAFQAQDVLTTAIGGMSPKAIALQQGTQIAGAVSGLTLRETGSALAGAVTNLLNPVSLVSIAFTGLAAAGIQYFMKSTAGAKTLDDALKANNDNLQILKTSYHALNSEISGNLGGNSAPNANLRANDIVQQAVARQEGNKYLAQLGARNGLLSYFGGQGTPISSLQNLTGNQLAFKQPVDELLAGVRSGTTDFAKFEEEVEKRYQTLAKTSDGNNAGQTTASQWRAAADAMLGAVDSALKVDSTIKVLGADGKETSQSLRPFQDAINRLKLGMAENHPDFVQFTSDVEKVGQSTGLQQVADQVIVLAKNLLDLNLRMRETDVLQNKIFNDRGPNGRLLSQGETSAADDNSLGLYEAQQRVTLERGRQAFNAQLSGITARSPVERGAAAREAASAEYNNDESPAQRRQRIDQAGALARAQAQNGLDEAAKERKRSLDESIASQQLELTTIGKTGGEVAALRMQYQMTAQVQAEAAKNNISVSQQELELIKQKSAEYGRLAAQIATANLRNDLQFERDQLYRSPTDQQIASRQRGAGMAVDLNSADAQFMKQTARIDETRTAIKGFFTDFSQQLVSNGGKAGEALGAALKTSLLNQVTKIGDAAFGKIANFLTDALLGTGKSAGAAGITSASGVAGAGLNLGASLLKGSAANDNAVAGAGSALGFGGNYRGSGVDSRLTDILGTAAQKFPGFKVSAISGFRAGDPRFHGQGMATDVQLTDAATGKALSNYQDPATFATYEKFAQTARQVQMDKYPGLSDQFRWGGYFSGGKGKYGAVDEMHFDLAGNKVPMGGGSWANGLTPAQAALWPGVQSTGMNDAAKALDKLAGSAGNATKGVGAFGTSIGQLGQSLGGAGVAGAFPAAPSAGIGGLFSQLFGGGLTSFGSSVAAASPQFASVLAKGGVGLFASGGFTGVGGANDPAGIVHRGEVVWSQRDVARAGGVAVVEGMRLGYRGYAGGGPVDVPPIHHAAANANAGGQSGAQKIDIGVTFDEDEGFRSYVKKTSQEQATRISQQGFADLSDSQRRGGFLDMQQRAVAQRG